MQKACHPLDCGEFRAGASGLERKEGEGGRCIQERLTKMLNSSINCEER